MRFLDIGFKSIRFKNYSITNLSNFISVVTIDTCDTVYTSGTVSYSITLPSS